MATENREYQNLEDAGVRRRIRRELRRVLQTMPHTHRRQSVTQRNLVSGYIDPTTGAYISTFKLGAGGLGVDPLA